MLKKHARKYLSEGNNKLNKNIGIFNIPATMQVCGRLCKGCYAIKAQNLYPSVLPSREGKLELSRQADFVEQMIESIETLGLSFIRIHESGEFYSQEYLDKWQAIAEALPNVTFVAYSKRFSDFNFYGIRALKNTIIIDSLHYKTLNYGKLERKPEMAVLCPSNRTNKVGCNKGCNICYNVDNKIQLETQSIYFEGH